jgi:hypothetical protein
MAVRGRCMTVAALSRGAHNGGRPAEQAADAVPCGFEDGLVSPFHKPSVSMRGAGRGRTAAQRVLTQDIANFD